MIPLAPRAAVAALSIEPLGGGARASANANTAGTGASPNVSVAMDMCSQLSQIERDLHKCLTRRPVMCLQAYEDALRAWGQSSARSEEERQCRERALGEQLCEDGNHVLGALNGSGVEAQSVVTVDGRAEGSRDEDAVLQPLRSDA